LLTVQGGITSFWSAAISGAIAMTLENKVNMLAPREDFISPSLPTTVADVEIWPECRSIVRLTFGFLIARRSLNCSKLQRYLEARVRNRSVVIHYKNDLHSIPKRENGDIDDQEQSAKQDSLDESERM
jgi:hypothetical protein